jgi:hypothetical protein
MAEHEQHIAASNFQQNHQAAAMADHGSYARFNGGRPSNAAMERPMGYNNNANQGGQNFGGAQRSAQPQFQQQQRSAQPQFQQQQRSAQPQFQQQQRSAQPQYQQQQRSAQPQFQQQQRSAQPQQNSQSHAQPQGNSEHGGGRSEEREHR